MVLWLRRIHALLCKAYTTLLSKYWIKQFHRTRPIDPDESTRINSDDDSIPYKKDLSEDSPEPTEFVKTVESPLPAVESPYLGIESPLPSADPQPNPNTFGLPLNYPEPTYDPTLPYRTAPFSYEENLDDPHIHSPPPPPEPQHEPLHQPQLQPQLQPQPGQSRQWGGETEIN